MKTKLTWVGGYVGACCLAAAVAGCSSSKGSGGSTVDASSGGTTGSGGASTGGTTGGGGASAGGTTGSKGGADGGAADAGVVTVSGVAVDVTTGDATKNFDATKYPALEGVQVCVYGNTAVPCVTTDANGKYELTGAPLNAQFYLSYKKTGYTSELYAVAANPGGSVDAPAILMTTTTFTASWGTKAGVPVDATKGEILFGATTQTVSSTPFHELFGTTELYYLKGFSVTISPAATAGPVFTSAAWAPDPSLKASSDAGWGFYQATPGNYTLTFTHAGLTCGAIQTMVVAGYSTTYVGVLCTGSADAGNPTDAAPHPG